MKRIYVFILLAAASVLTLQAVDPRTELGTNPDRSASNHYAYPYPADKTLPQLTPAPAGYEAFYIDHYGRHGSRWLTHANTYSRPVRQLEKAQSEHMLTLQGERLLKVLHRVLEASEKRDGDLSDFGAEQHQQIAERMYRNFPSVFAGDARIDARSTVVIRCILSMQNETMTLRTLNPALRITTDASYHDMPYMGWGYGEDTLANHIRTEVAKVTDSLYRRCVHPERFVAQLVTDPDWAAYELQCQFLMRDVFDVAGSLQGHHEFDDVTLYQFFTTDELFELWRLKNIYWYCHWANAPLNGNRMPYIERALMRDMIAKADEAIASGEQGASLRFGHETCVLPLACLMELDSVNYSCEDLDSLHLHWQDYNIIPKACNIQVVFYRPVGTTAVNPDDVLVKVLFNEHEATLPVGHDTAPYCRWSDLKSHWQQRIAPPVDWAAPAPVDRVLQSRLFTSGDD